MGNIGPQQQRYEVLPVPAYGVDDADLWTVDPRVVPLARTAPANEVEQAPVDEASRRA